MKLAAGSVGAVEAGDTPRRQLADAVLQPVPARFVQYRAGGCDHTLATTLLDRKRSFRNALADLCHARWGAGEHSEAVKRLLRLAPFPGQPEELVPPELRPCFTLMAMTRLFPSHCEAEMPVGGPGSPPCGPVSTTARGRLASMSNGSCCGSRPR